MRILVLTLFVAASAAPATEELWVETNAAFRAGRFDAAVEGYRALVAAGIDDGDVYYNLGNAHLRRGELAEAIAAYHEARVRLPRDEDVAANLRFARQRTRDSLAPPDPAPALRTIFFWHYALSPGELVTALAATSLLFWTALGVWLYRRRPLVRSAVLTFGVALAALAPSFTVRALAPWTIAVIQPEEAPVYSGVGEDTVVRFRLHEGAEVAVTGREDDWLRIRLPDGNQGWLPARDVILVEG